MENRANYVAVGLFTLLVFAAAFAFVYWVSRAGENQNLVAIDVRIQGSVTGLGEGSDIRFNGIKVGRINSVTFDRDDPRVVIAHGEVGANTPVRQDTKATLTAQGLTGISYIELSGGTPTASNLLNDAKNADTIALINADPSAVADIIETARRLASRADRVLASLEGFVEDNRAPLSRSVANIEKFSNALANNSDGVDEFLAGMSKMAETISSFSQKLDGTISALEKIAQSIDPVLVSSTVANIETFSEDLKGTSEQVKTVVGSVNLVVGDLKKFSATLNTSLENVDKLVAALNPVKIKSTVDGIASTVENAQQLIADASKVSKTLAARTGDIDQTIVDVREMAGRLNAASTKVDRVLTGLDSLLGSDETGNLMAQASEAITEYRALAQDLRGQIGQISANINNFSDRGLGEVQSLVNQSRRSMVRIERVISDFENDPQRFIFGGSTVRESSGRIRRKR